jgi:isopenicillin-N epimerase
VLYLNHGTVGVAPRRVLAAQQAIRDEIERGPSQFLLRRLTPDVGVAGRGSAGRPLLRAAADAVAGLVGGRGDDLAFVDNVTTAVTAVLRAVPLATGDEILVTDLAYGAVAIAATHRAREAGASVRTVRMPDPPYTPEGIVEAMAAELGPRTKLAIIDHITSETALVLPVAAIVARCHAAGVPVLVDGAHAPGAIALDIPSLGADWYAANLHKWAWTPRSAGILWAAPERHADLHAPVWSWGADTGFPVEFDWIGTRDPSAWLAAPAAIAYLREVGLESVFAWNHALAWHAARRLSERFGQAPPAPESMIGTMVTVALPAAAGRSPEDATRLRDALLFEDRIEVPVLARRERLGLRVSAQVYLEESDLERMADAVLARLPRKL